MNGSIKWAAASAACALALLGANAANATTFYLLSVEDDQSEVTVTEPAAFTDPSPGHRRASLIDIGFMGSADITDIEFDCAGRRVLVISEKLYDVDGTFRVDKTSVNERDWIAVPANTQLEDDRALICGWPGSREEGLDLTFDGFWPLVGRIYDSLEVPSFDDSDD